jgi:hypothetical protein
MVSAAAGPLDNFFVDRVSAVDNSKPGKIESLVNSGSIVSTSINGGDGITNSGSINLVTNSGVISSDTGSGIYNAGSINSLINTKDGVISGPYGQFIDVGGTIDSLLNEGTIRSIGGDPASGDAALFAGRVNNMINTGVLAGQVGGLFVSTNGSIGTLTNTGLIYATALASLNFSLGSLEAGLITTFNNLQGPGTVLPAGVSLPAVYINNAVIYRGGLPLNYNIIINSPNRYGSLLYQYRAATPPGTMTFNIYGNNGTTLVAGVPASTLTSGTTYSAVFRNLFTTQSAATQNYGAGSSPATLLGTSSIYSGYSWTLKET